MKYKIDSTDRMMILYYPNGDFAASAIKDKPKKRFIRTRISCKVKDWDEIMEILKAYMESK